jgi:hypothetical protein
LARIEELQKAIIELHTCHSCPQRELLDRVEALLGAPLPVDKFGASLVKEASVSLLAAIEADAAELVVEGEDDRGRFYDRKRFLREQELNGRTVSHWAKIGLAPIEVEIDGERQSVFTHAQVDAFLLANQELLANVRRFPELRNKEKDPILARARALAAEEMRPGLILQRLARGFKRSQETICKILEGDKELWAKLEERRSDEGALCARYRSAPSQAEFLEREGLSLEALEAVLRDRQLAAVCRLDLEYVPSKTCERALCDPRLAEEICGPEPEAAACRRRLRVPENVPVELRSLYETPNRSTISLER